MAEQELKQVFECPDGEKFDTKAEAQDHMRKPKIKLALMEACGHNEDLANWLLNNQELVEDSFDIGTIKRVTKSERNKLEKALTAISEDGNSKFAFVTENVEAVLDSFRWPKVTRMDADEKIAVAKKNLTEAGNADVAEWTVANKDLIIEACAAGKVKRVVSPKATEALAAYRAKCAAKKAAKEAAEAGQAPEAAPVTPAESATEG